MSSLATRMSSLAPEGAYAVLFQAQELERAGKNIIHLEIGQPDFPTPKHIVEAAVQALRNGKTKYTPSLGIVPLRQCIASSLTSSHGKEVDYRQIAITPSGKTAIFAAMAAVVNPGDEVIYPDPGFPTYKTLIDFFGAKPVPVPLVEESHFSFDMAEFRRRLSKKTKLVILNSPSNPTGGVIPRKDLEEIADRIGGGGAWVLSDEMYRKILYINEPYTSIYSLPNMKSRTIIVDGFSKTYAMTGWRLGYLVAPTGIIVKIDYLLTHSVGCTASFTQEAGIAAIESSQKQVTLMVSEFRKRRDFVVKTLNTIPGITCQIPDGAFYVFPNISSFKRTSKQLASYLLQKAGVALLDGTAFGMHGEGHLRLSYAADMKTLAEGLDRIRVGLSALAR